MNAPITLHEVALARVPIGIECAHCVRHVLLTAEKARARFGDSRTLEQARLYCGECGSRKFSARRFSKRSEASAFMRNH
jgi:Zn finger protein HypA/HybF involved in hydrogenase expression